MGFNTTIMILNDHLSHIEEDPDFGRKLADAVKRLWTARGETVDFGSGVAIETHHADYLTAVVVGGNTGRRLGSAGVCGLVRFEDDAAFQILSTLADEHGFELKRRGPAPLWSVDAFYEGEWKRLAEKPSADACKAVAREFREHASGPGLRFRLYDPQGRLYAVAPENSSWRMKWVPGNMATRDEMARRDAEAA